MSASILHDGIEWRIGARGVVLAWSVGLLAPSLVAVVAGPLVGLLPLSGLGTLGVVLWGLVVAQRGRPVVVRVGQRAVHVGEVALPLDELEVARLVEPPMPDGAWSVVLRAGDVVASVGEGQPKPHLEWLLLAIDEARARFRAREQVDGREYSFQRKAPEALTGLIDREREPPNR